MTEHTHIYKPTQAYTHPRIVRCDCGQILYDALPSPNWWKDEPKPHARLVRGRWEATPASTAPSDLMRARAAEKLLNAQELTGETHLAYLERIGPLP